MPARRVSAGRLGTGQGRGFGRRRGRTAHRRRAERGRFDRRTGRPGEDQTGERSVFVVVLPLLSLFFDTYVRTHPNL